MRWKPFTIRASDLHWITISFCLFNIFSKKKLIFKAVYCTHELSNVSRLWHVRIFSAHAVVQISFSWILESPTFVTMHSEKIIKWLRLLRKNWFHHILFSLYVHRFICQHFLNTMSSFPCHFLIIDTEVLSNVNIFQFKATEILLELSCGYTAFPASLYACMCMWCSCECTFLTDQITFEWNSFANR